MYEVENMDFKEIAEMSFEEMESETRLQQLAVEIVTFDRQAKITAVSCAIEIGERLLEAKELVPHGEWGNWLKKNVNYSQSTANNFMRLYKGVRERPGSLFTTLTNSQTIMNLDVSKALCTYRASTRGARGVCIRARCREYVHPGPERSLAGK